jgi:RNA polymerase sigma factor (sigma-70 family)
MSIERAADDELVAKLVEENMGWAQAIARCVARSWNLDWQLDGLDGGAYEALLFCARRFDPSLGVPFRAYARRRIHEASTEEARKSKSWQHAVGANSAAEQDAREISYRLFEVFPELREGFLPADEESSGEDQVRTSIRQLLTSASVIAAFQESGAANQEKALEYKQLFEAIALLDLIHQMIIWSIYWGGQSMRAIAEEWGTDELTVIREHREILKYVQWRVSNPRSRLQRKLKIRPSLRNAAQTLKKKRTEAPFARFAPKVAALLILCTTLLHSLAEVLHG